MTNGLHWRTFACVAALAIASLAAGPARAQFMAPYGAIVVPPPPAQSYVIKKPKPPPPQDAETQSSSPPSAAAPTCRPDPRTGACH